MEVRDWTRNIGCSRRGGENMLTGSGYSVWGEAALGGDARKALPICNRGGGRRVRGFRTGKAPIAESTC